MLSLHSRLVWVLHVPLQLGDPLAPVKPDVFLAIVGLDVSGVCHVTFYTPCTQGKDSAFPPTVTECGITHGTGGRAKIWESLPFLGCRSRKSWVFVCPASVSPPFPKGQRRLSSPARGLSAEVGGRRQG